MRKDEPVLNDEQLITLIQTGFDPTFRSLAGIYKDAAEKGAHIAYLELCAANRLNKYSTAHYEQITNAARLDRADDQRLIEISRDSTANAIQYAARLGYNRMYAK